MKRDIFGPYHNGVREVFADPLLMRDQLAVISQGALWELRKKEQAISSAGNDFTIIAEGLEARKHLVDIARQAFGMAEFNEETGQGSTATECLAVMEEFLAFLNQKKTTQEPQPTTLPPTASTPPPPTQPTTAITSAS